MRIALLREPGFDPDVPLPSYETTGAAGADTRANFEDGQPVTLAPGARALIPTGLRIEIPEGYEVQIRPRSGLALKHGISVPNAPGTIDADYRGLVGVILVNLGDRPFVVEHGARVAQMVVAQVTQARLVEVTEIAATERGSGGFGSTGTT